MLTSGRVNIGCAASNHESVSHFSSSLFKQKNPAALLMGQTILKWCNVVVVKNLIKTQLLNATL